MFIFGWFKEGFALYHVQELLQTCDLVTYDIYMTEKRFPTKLRVLTWTSYE